MTNEALRPAGVGIAVIATTDLAIPSTLRQRRNEREGLPLCLRPARRPLQLRGRGGFRVITNAPRSKEQKRRTPEFGRSPFWERLSRAARPGRDVPAIGLGGRPGSSKSNPRAALSHGGAFYDSASALRIVRLAALRPLRGEVATTAHVWTPFRSYPNVPRNGALVLVRDP
jgi:hypothetical protein